MKMRRKAVIMKMLFLVMPVLFWTCSQSHSPFTSPNAPLHFHELSAIEGLLETHPDIALDSISVLKKRVDGQTITVTDANELLLREVQAQYKTRLLTEQSPDLAPVIVFYDSLATLYPNDPELKYLQANAYYYKGVECAFSDDDVAAFRCYLHALQVMRSQDDWDNNQYARRFIALTYTRLSELLYRYGLNDEAIETCHNAASFFASDSDRAAIMRYEAAIYQAGKEYDKALARFQEAESLMPVGDGVMQLSIGAKFYELRQLDSAYPHLKRAFASGDSKARVDAAAKLADICRNRELYDEELLYTRFYVDHSMKESRMASRKMEIEYLFGDFNSLDTTNVRTQKSGNGVIFILLALLLIFIGLLAFIMARNRSRISHIENQISDIEEKHRQENADKEMEISKMEQQLNDTRERLENVTNRTFEEAWEGFNESAIAMKIKGMLEGNDIMIKNVGLFPKLKLKEVDFIELVRTVNDNFRDCSQRFLKIYPELNAADFRQCCLAMLGLNDAQIAVLEGISYSGANRRSKKILTAMQTEDTLEQAIVSFLKYYW